jgi:hypothetical protein
MKLACPEDKRMRGLDALLIDAPWSLHGSLLLVRRLDISIFSRALFPKKKTDNFLVQLQNQLVRLRTDTVTMEVGYIIGKS